jgi:hypothetical protein
MLKRFAVIALNVAVVATSSSAFARGRRIQHIMPEQTSWVRIMADASLPASSTQPAAAPSSPTTPRVAEDLYRPR